jgi:hypothetical protein
MCLTGRVDKLYRHNCFRFETFSRGIFPGFNLVMYLGSCNVPADISVCVLSCITALDVIDAGVSCR